jgi:hypothetical protein
LPILTREALHHFGARELIELFTPQLYGTSGHQFTGVPIPTALFGV